VSWILIVLGIYAFLMPRIVPALTRRYANAYPSHWRGFATRLVSSRLYALGCYATGLTMILVGVVALRERGVAACASLRE
jgi:hypothetical protein